MTNRDIQAIVQAVISPFNQTTSDGVATSIRNLHAVRAVLHKDIVMGATRSTAGVLKDPPVINWKDASGSILVDKNTVVIPPRTTTQVLTVTGPSVTPISIGSQKIQGPRRSIILQEARNAESLDAFNNRFPDEHRDPMLGWSKIICSRVFTDKTAYVYAHIRMNFGSDTVLS